MKQSSHNETPTFADTREHVPTRLRVSPVEPAESESNRQLAVLRSLLFRTLRFAAPLRRLTSWLGGLLHYRCPACHSEEVYPMRRDRSFATSLRERAWVRQTLFCERCLHVFHRRGRLFLAPRPLIRPEDAELYDA